eukprot:m.11627 g.11627  ORF g.11627 m.11627 type:complete len:64 (-) comp9862_c0_seq1:494-685(-)
MAKKPGAVRKLNQQDKISSHTQVIKVEVDFVLLPRVNTASTSKPNVAKHAIKYKPQWGRRRGR